MHFMLGPLTMPVVFKKQCNHEPQGLTSPNLILKFPAHKYYCDICCNSFKGTLCNRFTSKTVSNPYRKVILVKPPHLYLSSRTVSVL